RSEFRIGVALAMITTDGELYQGAHTGDAIHAVYMAIQEINNQNETYNGALLPYHGVTFVLEDSKCDIDYGRIAARSLFNDWDVEVVVGTSCSSGSHGAQKVLHDNSIPQISGFAASTSLSTSGVSSSDDAFPYFMRTIPSNSNEALAMADVVRYYNWSRVVTVAVEDEYGTSAVSAFHAAVESLGVLVREEDRFTYPYGTQEFATVVSDLAETQAFIFVTFGHARETISLMEQAYAAGVGGVGYVWLGGESSTNSALLSESLSGSNLSEEEKNDVLRGYIGVRPFVNMSTNEYAAFAERWEAQPATLDEATGECSSELDDAGLPIWKRANADGNGTTYEATKIGLDGIFFYESTYVVVRALHELLEKQNHSKAAKITRQELMDAMLAQDFVGVSGHVAFDDAGDRRGTIIYEVMNHAGNSTLELIGLWDVDRKYRLCEELGSDLPCSNVVWSTGSSSVPKANFVKVGVALAAASKSETVAPLMGAIRLALREINDSPTYLWDVMLRFALQDSGCDSAGGKEAAAALLDWNVDVVIGNLCSESTKGAQSWLEPSNTPQISGSSSGAYLSTADDSSGEDAFPYFMRTIPSNQYDAVVMADLVDYYNWSAVVTIAVEDEYGLSGAESFHEASLSRGFRVRAQDRITYPYSTEDFSQVVQTLKSTRSTIYVSFGYAQGTARLMEQAYAADVGTEGSVWLMFDDQAHIWGLLSGSEEEKNEVLRGYIGVRPLLNMSTNEYATFAERWEAQPATLDEATGECSSELDDAGLPIWKRANADGNGTTYEVCIGMNYAAASLDGNVMAAYYYDAVYVVGRAFHDLLHSGATTLLGAELKDAMLAQDFVGVSGHVAFDDAGDRSGTVSYEVVNHDAGEGALVAHWTQDLGYVECIQRSADPSCSAISWNTADNTVPKSADYHVGVVLDILHHTDTDTHAGTSLSAIRMALTELNEDRTILPDLALKFAVYDSKCNASGGDEAALAAVREFDSDVVVGATCSEASEAAQERLWGDNVPQISGGATSIFLSTSGDASDVDAYPYFMRTSSSHAHQAAAMAAVMRYYDWSRVVTVAVEDEYGTSAVSAFHASVESLGVIVREEDRFTYPYGTQEFATVVSDLAETQAFIFVTFGHARETISLMEQAYAAGVGGVGYVWLGGESSTNSALLSESLSGSNLSEEEKNEVLRGYIGVRPFVNMSTNEYAAFAERWEAQPATLDEATGECSSELDDAGLPIWKRANADGNGTTYEVCIGMNYTAASLDGNVMAAYYYDAVYVVAHALSDLTETRGESRSQIAGAELKDAMLAQDFVGVSGHVAFDDAGDRSAGLMYEVVNHAGNSRLERVGYWDVMIEYSECSGEPDCHAVVWAGGDNVVPVDGTCDDTGFVFDQNTWSCVPCRVGTFYNASTGACVQCAAGTISLSAGATTCLSCKEIDSSFYQDLPGQAQCKVCPFGADCSSGVAAVGHAGYWRDSDDHTRFYECYSTGLHRPCLGETDPYRDPGCLEGHTGPLCAACVSGYAPEHLFCRSTCKSCYNEGYLSRAELQARLAAVGLAFAMLAMAFLYWPWFAYCRREARRSAPAEEGEPGELMDYLPLRLLARAPTTRLFQGERYVCERAHTLRSMEISNEGMRRLKLLCTRLGQNMWSTLRRWGCSLSSLALSFTDVRHAGARSDDATAARLWDLACEVIAAIVAFVQVVGSYGQMNIDWPGNIDAVVVPLSESSSFGSTSLHNLYCKFPSIAGFFSRYYFNLFLVLAIVATFLLLYVAAGGFLKAARHLQVFRMVTLKAIILVLFCIYPLFSFRLMLVFPCRKIYNISYLVHDMSVQCFTMQHTRALLVGLVCGVVLFICGVPFFFWRCMSAFKVPYIVRQKELDVRMKNLLVYFLSQPVIDRPQYDVAYQDLDPALVDIMHAHFHDKSCSSYLERYSAMHPHSSCAEKGDARGLDALRHVADGAVSCGTLSSSDQHELKVLYADQGTAAADVCTQGAGVSTHIAKSGNQEARNLSQETRNLSQEARNLSQEAKVRMLLEYAAGNTNLNVCHFSCQWWLHLEEPYDSLHATRKLEHDAIVHIGFLFAAYRPELYYFEIIESIRKFLLVIVPVVFDDIRLQLLSSALVCISHLVALHHLKPNSNYLTHLVNLWNVHVLLLYNLYGWCMLVDLIADDGTDTNGGTIVAASIVIAIGIPGLVSAALMVQSLSVVLARYRKQWLEKNDESQALAKKMPSKI
ncbi:hypothetical protein CYMTET_33430, partial [Cymbomonas tetramitiformis]